MSKEKLSEEVKELIEEQLEKRVEEKLEDERSKRKELEEKVVRLEKQNKELKAERELDNSLNKDSEKNSGISRRGFLKGLGALGVGALAASSPVAGKMTVSSNSIQKDGQNIWQGGLFNTNDYLQLSGGNVMNGDLNLGGNSLTNVTNVDGVNVSGHVNSTSNPHRVGLEQARSQNNTLSGNIDLNGNSLTSSNGAVKVQNANLDVGGSVNAENTWDKYTFDLSDYSESNWYPVSMENSPTHGDIHKFMFSSDGGSSSQSYNMNTLLGFARGGGWSDKNPFADVNLMRYTDDENTIYGIYMGEEGYDDIVVYVRGGRTYDFYSSSDITGHTSDYSPDSSTFEAGVSTPSGTKISSILSLHDKDSGKITTQNLNMVNNQAVNFRLENRSGDPSSAGNGRMWLRTDL